MYGDVVLANSKKGIIPAIIKFITRSTYSHSLITIPNMLDMPMCMEAADTGISVLRFDSGYTENPDQDIVVYEVDVSQEAKDKAIIKCANYLETSYGYLELPWFIWRAVCNVFGVDIKKKDNWSQNGTICSELCRIYLTECGLGHIFDGYGKSSLNAQDLKNVMDANPSIFRRVYATVQ